MKTIRYTAVAILLLCYSCHTPTGRDGAPLEQDSAAVIKTPSDTSTGMSVLKPDMLRTEKMPVATPPANVQPK